MLNKMQLVRVSDRAGLALSFLQLTIAFVAVDRAYHSLFIRPVDQINMYVYQASKCQTLELYIFHSYIDIFSKRPGKINESQNN